MSGAGKNFAQGFAHTSSVTVAVSAHIQGSQTLVQRHIVRRQRERGFQRGNRLQRDVVRDKQLSIGQRTFQDLFDSAGVLLMDHRSGMLQFFHHERL